MTERRFVIVSLSLLALAPALAGADGGCSPGDVPIGREADAGAAGSGSREEPSCEETERTIRDLLAAHRGCASDRDCTTVNVSCLPSDNCTGNAYVNSELDQRALAELTSDLNTCVNGSPELGCPVCDRFDPPPACVEGVCGPPVSDPRPEDPCAGKMCGDECTNCIDGEPCLTILQFCDGAGQCGGSVPCRDLGDDPCAGKACGDECSTCVDGEPCLAILEFCGHDGACSSTTPRCP